MPPVPLLTRDDDVAYLVTEQAARVGIALAHVTNADTARPLWQAAPLVVVHDLDAATRLPRRFGVVVVCDATQPPPENVSPRPLLVTHLPELTDLPACLIRHADGVIDPDHSLGVIRSMTSLALADPAHLDPIAAQVAIEQIALLDAWVSSGHPLPGAWLPAAHRETPVPDLPPGANATG